MNLTMVGAVDKESKMKFIVCAATAVFLLWGTPALAGPCTDMDSDGICDVSDNCVLASNPLQDDTDSDDCGNVCDANFDQDVGGAINIFDIFAWIPFNGSPSAPNFDMTNPIGNTINIFDLFAWIPFNGSISGPSGTSAGTPQCAPYP